MIARDIVLVYPDFTKKFAIYFNASTSKLEAAITQDNRSITLFGRKLTSAQQTHTITELELLFVVKTLKEFKGMLFGQNIGSLC